MNFTSWLLLFIAGSLVYLVLSAFLTIIFAKIPRKPLKKTPDWGNVQDVKIPTVNGKHLEAWVVEPEKIEYDETVVLVHGWARNRGRMVDRARIFGKAGYRTVIFSTRDHGDSDTELIGMNIHRFSQDISKVVEWCDGSTIIVGHSIGAGASIIAAAMNQQNIGAVIAEAPPFAIPESLDHIYRPVFKTATPLIMPGMRFVVKLFFNNLEHWQYSPKIAASRVSCPVLIIHGEKDDILPSEDSTKLVNYFDNARLWLQKECDHHNIEHHPDYEDKVVNFIQSIS